MSNNTTYTSRHTDCGFAMESFPTPYLSTKSLSEAMNPFSVSRTVMTKSPLPFAMQNYFSNPFPVSSKTALSPARNRSTTSGNALTLVESLKGDSYENI